MQDVVSIRETHKETKGKLIKDTMLLLITVENVSHSLQHKHSRPI